MSGKGVEASGYIYVVSVFLGSSEDNEISNPGMN